MIKEKCARNDKEFILEMKEKRELFGEGKVETINKEICNKLVAFTLGDLKNNRPL